MVVSLARLPSGSKIVEPQEIQSALLRMNELAVLYQDITKTADDKAAYELESNKLDAGIFDMAGKTFNGVDLFFTDGKVFTGDDFSSTLDQNNIADGLGRGATGDYKIKIKFEANAEGVELESKHKALIERAARRIEAMITGDISGGLAIDNTITAKLKDVSPSDGEYGTLVSAGATSVYSGVQAGTESITIDEADLDRMYEGGATYTALIFMKSYMLLVSTTAIRISAASPTMERMRLPNTTRSWAPQLLNCIWSMTVDLARH